MKRILFPEADNEFVKQAVAELVDIEPILESQPLEEAFQKLADSTVDGIVAGIDYSSRDVILAARDKLGLIKPEVKLFTSLFYAEFPDGRKMILSDGATCKHPTLEQMCRIIELVHEAAEKLLDDEPRIAMLSFIRKLRSMVRCSLMRPLIRVLAPRRRLIQKWLARPMS